jgi:signal peptidase I
MSEANPWYKIRDKRALEGRKDDLFRPSRALLPFPKSRGSQKALAPGYCPAPLRGFGKLPETAKKHLLEVFAVRFFGAWPNNCRETITDCCASARMLESFDFIRISLEEAALEFHKSTIREYFESIVITAIIALFAMTFVIQAYKIPTSSMESNLLVGDHLLVNKFAYGIHPSGFLSKLLPYKDPKRGDVIVFKYPNNPDVAYVKRLIGLPGEKLEMMGHTVLIDNKPLDEKKYHTQYTSAGSAYDNYGPFDIPEGQYFAMGDNRDNSQDSRFWKYLPRDYFLGKALVIYWSFKTPNNEYLQTTLSDRLGQFSDVFRNFFTKTRWERTLKIIR